MKRNFERGIKGRLVWFWYRRTFFKRAMKNENIFQDLSIVSEKSRKVQIWTCSESGQIFLLLQALCCSPESLDKPEPKGPFGLCYWFLPALILFATNHRQHLKRTSTHSSPIKDSAVQDLARELQSATSELLSLSLQRVSLGRPCNTSVLQSLVCNTVVIITGAPCNPYRLLVTVCSGHSQLYWG